MLYKSQELQDAMVAAGYSQQLHQAVRNFLRDAGYTGQLNAALNEYLAAQGYTGTFQEKLVAWGQAGFPTAAGTWILATNFWVDSGSWVDSDVWND